MTIFNYLHYQMINQLHSTLGAAILKSMQSLLGSTQTSHCVQLGPAAVPQLMVLKSSDNALLEGLSDHQERKKHKLSETRASHLQNGFLLVGTLWKVPVKDAAKTQGRCTTWPRTNRVLLAAPAALAWPAKTRPKRDLGSDFHSPGTQNLPTAWSLPASGHRSV